MNRTQHLILEKVASVKDTLFSHLGLSAGRVEELLYWGAIYLNKKRIQEDYPLQEGDYLRVHLEPRRFEVEKVDWKSRVVSETEDYFIVDKPPKIPVPPTLDNVRENVLSEMSRTFEKPLWITHRLDMPTQGLLVLAKNPAFQSVFNKWLNEGRVVKKYRALTARGAPLGRWVHYQKPMPGAPKEMSEVATTGWLKCELEVESSSTHAEGFENRIRLYTGRTHQIRAQFSLMGCSILGDELYGGLPRNELALQAYFLEFPDRKSGNPTSYDLTHATF